MPLSYGARGQAAAGEMEADASAAAAGETGADGFAAAAGEMKAGVPPALGDLLFSAALPPALERARAVLDEVLAELRPGFVKCVCEKLTQPKAVLLVSRALSRQAAERQAPGGRPLSLAAWRETLPPRAIPADPEATLGELIESVATPSFILRTALAAGLGPDIPPERLALAKYAYLCSICSPEQARFFSSATLAERVVLSRALGSEEPLMWLGVGGLRGGLGVGELAGEPLDELPLEDWQHVKNSLESWGLFAFESVEGLCRLVDATRPETFSERGP